MQGKGGVYSPGQSVQRTVTCAITIVLRSVTSICEVSVPEVVFPESTAADNRPDDLFGQFCFVVGGFLFAYLLLAGRLIPRWMA